ncbi:MAG: rubrerythrin family protein [Candidatus Angelobacter sp.]
MKLKFSVLMLVLGAALFVLGRATADKHPALHPQTKANFSTAMHGEAFAFAKYTMFAEQARKNGNTEVADLFEKTAKVEHLEHLREHAELAGVVGTDQENLKDAIKGEDYETKTMYPQFAREAKAAGDLEAAKRFEEVGKDEATHRDAFEHALTVLQAKHENPPSH